MQISYTNVSSRVTSDCMHIRLILNCALPGDDSAVLYLHFLVGIEAIKRIQKHLTQYYLALKNLSYTLKGCIVYII